MNALRRHLRPATWLALVAISALVLLPTLSHALSRAGVPGIGVEVCTSQGAKLLPADGGGIPASANPFEHCPVCTLSAGAAALPPALPVGWLAPALTEPVPGRSMDAPATVVARSSAQARAPPRRY